MTRRRVKLKQDTENQLDGRRRTGSPDYFVGCFAKAVERNPLQGKENPEREKRASQHTRKGTRSSKEASNAFAAWHLRTGNRALVCKLVEEELHAQRAGSKHLHSNEASWA
eukprot:6172863-Pleurochrysis_carterae.AAC.2